MKTSRVVSLFGLIILGVAMTACSGVAQNLDGIPAGVPAPITDPAGRDLVEPGVALDQGGGVTGEAADAAQADRSIIKTGEITVEVDSVAETIGAVRALVLELDGFISSSFQGEFDESATLTMRVPGDRFDDALSALHELGEVKAEATREEDVTAVVVDIEARLTNLRAAEVEYRELLDRAEQIEDILAIQNQLFQVRGEIEAMEAQLEYFTDQAEMATLTVSVIPGAVEQASTDFDPGAEVQKAVAQLVSFGQWLVSAGIWLLIVGVPLLIVGAVVVYVVIRVLRRFRPAVAKEQGPAS